MRTPAPSNCTLVGLSTQISATEYRCCFMLYWGDGGYFQSMLDLHVHGLLYNAM